MQDLARSRALLELLRGQKEPGFSVVLQTRAGLDYLSADPLKARVQLAAATALMDDIEPHDRHSPAIVQVVSFFEADRLADPAVIAESVQITMAAQAEYRELRRRGMVDDMAESQEVRDRTAELVAESAAVIAAIERSLPRPWSPAGLHAMFASGFLLAPCLWECREGLAGAVDCRTGLVGGAVREIDANGAPVPVENRIARAEARVRRMRL